MTHAMETWHRGTPVAYSIPALPKNFQYKKVEGLFGFAVFMRK
jgi:hypothetical protein